jgi:hypothetical protein
MVETRYEVERVAGSDSVPGPKDDDVSEGNLEGEGRQSIDERCDQVDFRDSEEEEDAEFASDIDGDYGDDDCDLKTDSACANNVLALAAQKSSESRPSFGNIVVNSSSDVHFGNKTFYNGPVTIKQFVYTTKNGSVDVHHSESDDTIGDSKVGVDEVLDPVSNGLPNGKVQCPPKSETIISIPSAPTLTSEPSPEVNGSLFPIWQPSTSEYRIIKTRKNPTG